MGAPYVKICLILPKKIKKGTTYQKVIDMPVVAKFNPKTVKIYVHEDKNEKYFVADVYIES